MYVSLACTTCSCMAAPNTVAIGEVGELRFPNKCEDYKITRFFPVIRRLQQNSQSPNGLLPAGKIKLCIRVEVEKIASDRVCQPELPTRPPFALPTNFGEALQLKRKQLKATVVPEDNSNVNASNQLASQVNLEASEQLLKQITIETTHYQINGDDLNIEGRIGEGIHSCVSVGILRGRNNASFQQVAVKEFRHQHACPPVNVLRTFQQEYRILERCQRMNGCRHVVGLLGITLEPRLIILMEYFNHGSLAQCMNNEAAWKQMSIKQKITIGLKIGQGIAWMHKNNMIHRDIKSHNILVGDDLTISNPTVKIGDLGSAVLWNQNESLLTEEVGSSGYTAPEIFTQNGYDEKIDVWSFGIVLWELTSSSPQTRVNPFTGMAGEEFVRKVQNGCRPSPVHPHQLFIRSVVEKCWIFDPSLRPNMAEVVNQLESLLESCE
ncbi:Protein kinase [Phytophthora megakarya]|uniref:Protein kinase n=1 Tax=Phytophthora megakarya TaxID=4795 RepID=A0A225W4W3_9STRA|nr:Protein kinase [Phytophthora megakarya]